MSKLPKKQQLPKTIKILGRNFEINYKPNLKEEDGNYLYGETFGRDLRIDINSSISLQMQKDTLFHEAIHAALEVSGLTGLLDDKLEEAIVTCLEHAFAHIVDVSALGIDTGNDSVL